MLRGFQSNFPTSLSYLISWEGTYTKHVPGSMDHPMHLVQLDHHLDQVHGPTLIFKSKLPLLIWKFTGGQGMKNTDSDRRNLKMPAFRFRVDEKHFENGVFGSDDNPKIMWFLCLKLKRKFKNDRWLVRLKFLRRKEHLKRLMHFQSESSLHSVAKQHLGWNSVALEPK